MGTEHWWNDTDRGKPKYWDRNLLQCHFVHRTSDMDWPVIEPGPQRSMFISIHMLLLLEGQTGDAWKPIKKECSFVNWGELDRKG